MYCPNCGCLHTVDLGNENAPDSTGMAVFCEYPDNDYEGYDFNITKWGCLSCDYYWYVKL